MGLVLPHSICSRCDLWEAQKILLKEVCNSGCLCQVGEKETWRQNQNSGEERMDFSWEKCRQGGRNGGKGVGKKQRMEKVE